MARMLTYIAGLSHRPGALPRLRSMIRGEAVRLAPEPTNRFDRNAVAIYDGDFHLGYVPRADAPAVAAAIERGLAVEACLDPGAPGILAIVVEWDSNQQGDSA